MKGCVLEIISMRGPRIMWGRETFVCRGVARRGYWILLSPSKSFGGEQRHKGMWTNPATAPARAPMQDHRCAAGEHCLMKMTPLILVNGHMCLNCNRPCHGSLCGQLWDERGDDCTFRVEDLSDFGRENQTRVGGLICKGCMA